MPTLASQPTSATIWRARRRERRVQTRISGSVISPYSSPGEIRRRITRRPNRDQAAFGLDNCFDVCQDHGFHQDPDVRIGQRASTVNHFAVLDPEVSVPSLITPAEAEFTFTYPPPNAAATTSTGHANLGDATQERPGACSESLLELPNNICLEQSKNDTTYSAITTPLPSIPTTTPTKARVKLPGTYPTSLHESLPSSGHNTPPIDYFDSIKIPSPLLYHRRSRGQLFTQSSDADLSTEVTKQFLLTCGRDLPEPDFKSYKVFEEVYKQEPLNSSSITSNPFLLPAVDKLLQKQRDVVCRNVPHPPWIVEPYHFDLLKLFTTLPVPLLEATSRPFLTRSSTPPISTVTNAFSIAQLGIPCNDSPASKGPSSLNARYSEEEGLFDFIFPKLPAPPSCVIDDAQQQDVGRQGTPNFIDDDPDEVDRRWQAFEDAVSKPKHHKPSSEGTATAYSTKVEPYLWSSQRHKPKLDFDLAACPTSDCLALVPARLYQHQYLAWPSRPIKITGPQETRYTVIQPPAVDNSNTTKVASTVQWFNDLGLEKEHTEGCPVAAESADSSGFGLEQMFAAATEAVHQDSLEPQTGDTEPGVLIPEAFDVPSSASESFDEGYFSGQSVVEVDLDDAVVSEDEWAEWDWDDTPQD